MTREDVKDEKMLESENVSFSPDTSRLTVEQRVELVEKQILIMHYQHQRIVSEIESEKGTRSRLNSDMLSGVRELEKRVRLLERAIWSGIGIILFVEFLFRAKLIP
jgi:hypothetical protein